MKPHYEYIDHTADILFRAYADSEAELFAQCGLALQQAQVEVSQVEEKETVTITGCNAELDRLLFDFLDDLLYYKDADLMVFSRFEIKIEKKDNEFCMECLAHGEKLDFSRHQPKVDVKAITMHTFEVKQTEKGWEAQVLIDI
jgi:SHS2 domain-containing protein